MHIVNPLYRSLAEDCVRAAMGGRVHKPRPIANHRVWLDGAERQWLTLIEPDGGVRIVQHAPELAVIGVMPAEEVRRLASSRAHAFTGRSIRGHFRSETRRRR